MKKTFVCRSLEETEKAAQEIAALLRGREVLAYFGGLGAGKTTFSRYLCGALGVQEEVTSPTFAMVHEYHTGKFPVYHFDMYRVDGRESLFSTGYYDYVGTGVLLIEWSENIADLLPEDAWRLRCSCGEGAEERMIELENGE